MYSNLNKTLAHTSTTAFRVVPYFAHESIDLPNLEQHLDVSVAQLCELKATMTPNSNDHGMLKLLDYDNGDDGLYCLEHGGEEDHP